MQTLRVCTLILALSGTCLLGQVQTPSAVSVTSGESPKLMPGQSFQFQLRFNIAPQGYGGGKISYRFEDVAYLGRSGEGSDSQEGGSVDLHDGQAIYSLSLRVTESMDKGKWKLTSVQIGKAVMKDIPVTDNVVFDIPLPPPVMHVQVPGKVVAGNSFHLEVTLDETPGLPPECAFFLGFSISPVARVAGFSGIGGGSVRVQSDRHSYEFTTRLDADVPSGAWKGSVNLGADRVGEDRCFPPQLPSWFQSGFSFTVEPAPSLVSPTAVSAIVNPSQIELLRGEADRLRAKAKQLEERLALGNKSDNQDILRNTLQEATADLETTEAKFKQQGLEQPPMQEVSVFFDDIRLGYQEALGILRKAAWLREKDGLLLRVSASRAGAPLNASRVLRSIRHNANAYDVVASTKALTFNLEVYSEPKGATISYRRRGGEYRSVDHATDWRIENLVRAVWLIRLQKPGYEDKEESFDAVANTRTSITITLTRK